MTWNTPFRINMLCNLHCLKARLRLLCNKYQPHSSLNLVSQQLKLCNIFIFGMAYHLVINNLAVTETILFCTLFSTINCIYCFLFKNLIKIQITYNSSLNLTSHQLYITISITFPDWFNINRTRRKSPGN